MSNLTNIKFIKDTLGAFGFTFSKQLGQNFLINPDVCPQMAMECDCDGIGVVEIGPGIGVLTEQLSQRAKKVVSIELDERLKPVLDTTLKHCDNVSFIFGDVLKLDLAQIIKENFDGMDVVVCANLPYYITSPILMDLLQKRLPIKSITVMVQKEAAIRLCAQMGTRNCGAVTAAVDYYAVATKLFDVSRSSFLPAPNVDSAVIKLDIRENSPIEIDDEKAFFKVIRAAFNQRRKTLNNSLGSNLGVEKAFIAKCLEKCGLKPTARAEELTLNDYAKLSKCIYEEK